MVHIKNNSLIYLLLAILLVFTIADAINNYNSGVYEDAHGLVGGTVGWFAPHGVLVFILSALTSLGLGIYLLSRKSK